jgi:hypothetical protein
LAQLGRIIVVVVDTCDELTANSIDGRQVLYDNMTLILFGTIAAGTVETREIQGLCFKNHFNSAI